MTLEACRQVMSLPCFPELADGEIEQVIRATLAGLKHLG